MTKKGDKEQDEDSFAVSDSWILRTLLGTYRILSRTRRPKNNSPIGVAFTIASFLGLSLIRVIIFHSLLSLGWPRHSKMITDAAASLTSIVHSTLLCTWLTVLFWKLGWRRYVPSWKLVDHKNTDWQDAATACLEFCTGYMLFDAFWLVKDTHDLGLLPLTEFEMLVLAHHALTSFYMLSCRLIGAGHVSAMILMLTGMCFLVKLDECPPGGFAGLALTNAFFLQEK